MVIITATYFLQFFLKDGTLEWYDLLDLAAGNQKYGGICLPMTIADLMGTDIRRHNGKYDLILSPQPLILIQEYATLNMSLVKMENERLKWSLK